MDRSGRFGFRRGNEALALGVAVALAAVVLAISVWPGWPVMETWLRFTGAGL